MNPVILFLIVLVAGKQDDWSICPAICKCKWVSGRKTAECANSGISTIPTSLSSEIQTVDLNGNSFHTLGREAFKNVGLINLQKIYLKSCNIEEVHKDIFKGLQILIEIDLSDNRIHVLHPGTFRDNIRLRVVLLNKNLLQKCEDGLFANLTFLQTVDFADCQLVHISPKTFVNVPNLQNLILRNNNLSHVNLSVVESLQKLRSLELHNNPWRCDCHLRPFRDWVIEKNLYSQSTSCSEPLHLQNRLWNEVNSNDFACKPQIIYPRADINLMAGSDEVTLSCRVMGNPFPEVHWVFNSRIIANSSRNYGDGRYLLTSENGKGWVNLTISRVRGQDRGEYTCVARSPGGIEERNMSLSVGHHGPVTLSDHSPFSLLIIIAIAVALSLMLITIFLLCCCIFRKRGQTNKKGNGVSPNGDIRHISAEQEKNLLTVVNPVQKPNRRYNAGGTTASDTTELTELSRNLLDEGSVIGKKEGGGEDEEGQDAYPDLIAFPGRGGRGSPVTERPTGRLTPVAYQPGFGTLPYSRSQSPFSPVGPVLLQRAGYVTIPRRPRVPSWSSAPTPTLDEPFKEPVYDNLGPRTTADGSSVLSLNKMESPRKEPLYADLRSSSPSDRRCWTPRPQQVPLKRVGSAEEPISSNPHFPIPKSKVAPKPPPKPVKNKLPLYEDEGEDGTEV